MGTTAEILWLCFLGCIIHTAAEEYYPQEISSEERLRPIRKRISDTNTCIPHSQPWMAALFDDYDPYCSGVLVHPQWVLSAAHCWKPSYTIGLGLHGLYDWFKQGSLIIKASTSIKHPLYVEPKRGNDLMLIKLNRPVVVSDTIRTLPITTSCPIPRIRCLISGWGRLANGYHPLDLQCGIIPVVSEQYCRFVLDKNYHDSIFCAGAHSLRGTCPGDSGGPLICGGVLQGIVSWGNSPCGQPALPGYYTNLCKFNEWIKKIIRTR